MIAHWPGPKPFHVADHLAGAHRPWATDWMIDKLLDEALEFYKHYNKIFQTLLRLAG